MVDQMQITFWGQRLRELRTQNGLSLDEMAIKIAAVQTEDLKKQGNPNACATPQSKSALSRVESGKMGEKTARSMVEYYCRAFDYTPEQIDQFCRCYGIAIPDTSALLKNTQLIEDLSKEYWLIIVPKPVIDELVNIKGNHSHKYSLGLVRRAWEVEKSLKPSQKVITVDYTGDTREDTVDCMIIDIAKKAAEKYGCKVDILSVDIDYSCYLSGHDSVHALYLHEYLATRQDILNIERMMRIERYYADSYDDAEQPSQKEVNAYLPDGTTLLISCVRNYHKPLKQRKAKIKWLMSLGADVNKRESANKFLPALSYAIQMRDQYEMFVFLLDECGADPNAGSRNPRGVGKVRQKNEGNMPLMIAAWWGKEKYVKKLCNHESISINQQDENGFTALIKACANGAERCADILIKAGADTRIIDIDGKNYLDHFQEFKEYGPLRTRFQRGKDEGNQR